MKTDHFTFKVSPEYLSGILYGDYTCLSLWHDDDIDTQAEIDSVNEWIMFTENWVRQSFAAEGKACKPYGVGKQL